MDSLWRGEWALRHQPSTTYLAGGMACLATLSAGYWYYYYHQRQKSDGRPSSPGPALAPQPLTQESVGLGLLLEQAAVPDLAQASVILRADLDSLADQIVDEGDSWEVIESSDEEDSTYEADSLSEDPLAGEDDNIDTPCLHYHFKDKGYNVADLPERIAALRELFTTLCDSPDDRLFLINVARRLLGGLAVAAKKDEEHLSNTFDRLMDYVSDGEHYATIMQELAQEGLHNLNAIDIVIELVLLGMLTYNERQPEIIIPGGFMSQLHILVEAFLPFQILEDPPGQTYMAKLKEMLLDFMEEIFSFSSAEYLCQSDLVDAVIILVAGLLQTMLSWG